jgi:hypothetical protein
MSDFKIPDVRSFVESWLTNNKYDYGNIVISKQPDHYLIDCVNTDLSITDRTILEDELIKDFKTNFIVANHFTDEDDD